MKQNTTKLKKSVSKLVKEFRRIRKSKGMSYQDVADVTGLHRTTIGLIEREKRVPTILTCLKISGALEIALYDLIKKVE